MNQTCSLLIGLIIIFTAAASNCASPSSETEQASLTLGASKVSEISFDPGKATLTKEARQEISDSIQEALKGGKIDEIKAAAWADREYPVEENKAPKQDIQLANQRAENLKKFIRSELKVKDVKTYNMAERPNALEKFAHTSDAQVKETMEATGAAPKNEKEKGLFNQKAQASKAVILIYLKK